MTLKADHRSPTWTLTHIGAGRLARRVAVSVSGNDLTGYSAQLAYYFFLSLFPLLMFLAALLAYLPMRHRARTVLAVLGKVLPTQALALVKGDFEGLIHQQHNGLLSFSVAFALYSASNVITAIGAGLNQVYGVREERPYWRVLLTALLLVLALALVFLVAFAIFFFGPIIANAVAGHLGIHLLPIVLDIIRWPILLLAVILAAALLYYFTPNVRQEWRWLTPGSVFAVFGWIASSLLFAFYVNNFGSYNKTYGSIGAVIILLTWMYLGGLVLLVGGQINSVIKHAAEGIDKKTETPADERRCIGHERRREARR